MNHTRLGAVVRAARRELGINQRELAAQIGVKASYIAYIETNQRKPSFRVLGTLAKALGLNGRELLLLSRPEISLLLEEPRNGARRAEDAWQRFVSNARLRRHHHITPGELRVLKMIDKLHQVKLPGHFLFILNSIRQAAEPPTEAIDAWDSSKPGRRRFLQ